MPAYDNQTGGGRDIIKKKRLKVRIAGRKLNNAPLGRGSRDPNDIEHIVDDEVWGCIKEAMGHASQEDIAEVKQGFLESLNVDENEDFIPVVEALFDDDDRKNF